MQCGTLRVTFRYTYYMKDIQALFDKREPLCKELAACCYIDQRIASNPKFRFIPTPGENRRSLSFEAPIYRVY